MAVLAALEHHVRARWEPVVWAAGVLFVLAASVMGLAK